MNIDLTAPKLQSVPTIQSSFIGVDFSFSVWTGRKKDKDISTALSRANRAKDNTASVTKDLLADNPTLSEIHKFIANVRNEHYSLTQPWSAIRVIKNDLFFNRYVPIMDGHGKTFWGLVRQFVDEYDTAVSGAAFALGDMFKRDDYPSRDVVSTKFKFVVAPVPIAADFRTDVMDEATKYIQQEYAKHYGDLILGAMSDAWERLHDSLSRMSERLDYQGKEDKKIFRDSLVENARDMVQLLADFNLTGDDAMDRARVRLMDALDGVTPEALREDDMFRHDVKRKVDAIIKDFAW